MVEWMNGCRACRAVPLASLGRQKSCRVLAPRRRVNAAACIGAGNNEGFFSHFSPALACGDEEVVWRRPSSADGETERKGKERLVVMFVVVVVVGARARRGTKNRGTCIRFACSWTSHSLPTAWTTTTTTTTTTITTASTSCESIHQPTNSPTHTLPQFHSG
ncbi:hypothetical protein IWX91DRAFT_342968, partial [Phyllosticta citricarpa]